jgi:hypothetical protein
MRVKNKKFQSHPSLVGLDRVGGLDAHPPSASNGVNAWSPYSLYRRGQIWTWSISLQKLNRRSLSLFLRFWEYHKYRKRWRFGGFWASSGCILSFRVIAPKHTHKIMSLSQSWLYIAKEWVVSMHLNQLWNIYFVTDNFIIDFVYNVNLI